MKQRPITLSEERIGNLPAADLRRWCAAHRCPMGCSIAAVRGPLSWSSKLAVATPRDADVTGRPRLLLQSHLGKVPTGPVMALTGPVLVAAAPF